MWFAMTPRPADNSPTPSGPSPPAEALPSTKTYVRAREPKDSTPSTSADASLPGLEDYEFLGEIARGGMGVVYKAKQIGIDRIVALKTLRSDALNHPQAIERFEREMRATARLQHPNIVPIYDVGHGQPYYTMRFMEGGVLGKQRERFGKDPRAAAVLVEKIARAVAHAHEQGVVHRDLKPSNILMDNGGEPMVSDFGLAKFMDSDIELTRTGAVLGTAAYMAPEQAAGRSRDVGPASDIWALGVILYELVVGRRPFDGDGGDEVKRRIMDDEPTRPSSVRDDIEPALETIVLNCLQKEPANRYATAAALADDLQRYLRGEAPAATRRRRRPVPVWLAMAACLAIVVAILFVMLGEPSEYKKNEPVAKLVPPIVLIGDTGPPKEFKWIEGEKSIVLKKQRDDAPFTLESKQVCLLQLLEKPPWKSFRLEGEIQHERGSEGKAGMFVVHSKNALTGPKSMNLYWAIVVSESGPFAGYAEWTINRYRADTDAFFEVPNAKHRFRSAKQTGKSNWRPIAIDVTPRAIRACWKDDEFSTERVFYNATVDATKIHHDSYVDQANDPRPFTPWNSSIGLVVREGAASFRRVYAKHQISE